MAVAGAGIGPALPSAPTLAVSTPDPPASGALEPNGTAVENKTGDRSSGAERLRGRADGARPAAPNAVTLEPRGIGFWVAAAVAAILVLGIGIAAWKLRDRPDQVAAVKPVPAVATDSPGKIGDRAEGPGAQTPPVVGATPPEPGPAATGGPPAEVPQASPPVPAPAAVQPAAPDAAATAESNPQAIPVSQRAALLVDAPEEPQKVKTYVGSVVWRTESVNAGQGQPLALAVRADVDIPEAKLKLSMSLQKNPEPQLPASHTIEFHFAPQAGNTLGNVKQINVPEMRKDDDAPTGDPLAGVPVAITENYFLVGLSRGPSEAQNLKLLSDRNWFDMSLLLVSGKVGKVTFEKGTSGQRLIEDALKSWQ